MLVCQQVARCKSKGNQLVESPCSGWTYYMCSCHCRSWDVSRETHGSQIAHGPDVPERQIPFCLASWVGAKPASLSLCVTYAYPNNNTHLNNTACPCVLLFIHNPEGSQTQLHAFGPAAAHRWQREMKLQAAKTGHDVIQDSVLPCQFGEVCVASPLPIRFPFSSLLVSLGLIPCYPVSYTCAKHTG